MVGFPLESITLQYITAIYADSIEEADGFQDWQLSSNRLHYAIEIPIFPSKRDHLSHVAQMNVFLLKLRGKTVEDFDPNRCAFPIT